ncbi:hypothetical protein PENTCL1PPCAC_5120, partial [Pristionchus entomophagus]
PTNELMQKQKKHEPSEGTSESQLHKQSFQKAIRPPLGMLINGQHWQPLFKPENVRSAKLMKTGRTTFLSALMPRVARLGYSTLSICY